MTHASTGFAGHGDTAKHLTTHALGRSRDPTPRDMSEQQSFGGKKLPMGLRDPKDWVSMGCSTAPVLEWEAGGWCFPYSLPTRASSPPAVSPALSCYSLGCMGRRNASNQASRRESRPGSILKEEGL